MNQGCAPFTFTRSRIYLATVKVIEMWEYTNPFITNRNLVGQYSVWAPYIPVIGRIAPLAIFATFQVSFARWQPLYTLSKQPARTLRTYSTGFILRLYGVNTKCTRRAMNRGATSITFFKRYLPRWEGYPGCIVVCRSYKRRFDFFIQTQLAPFAYRYLGGLVFTPKLVQRFYKWRRVAPIKKRIRARLGIRARAPRA